MHQQQVNTPAARRKARRFAMQGLYEWQLSGNAPFEIEARYRVENAMHKVDLPYFHELLHQAVLMLAAFELVRMPEIPYRVVINEAVELAKTYGGTDGYKYVNGVLDRVAACARPHEATARS